MFPFVVCNAQEPEAAKQIIKRGGWDIPGFVVFETMQPENKWTVTLDGRTVEISMWGPELIRKQQGPCNSANTALIPRYAVMFQRTLKYDEVPAVAYKVFRFSFQKQSFLYDMETNPCAGGIATGSLDWILFYDDDGDGCFETLEYKPFPLPQVEPWHPRLAKWIIEPTSKMLPLCVVPQRAEPSKKPKR